MATWTLSEMLKSKGQQLEEPLSKPEQDKEPMEQKLKKEDLLFYERGKDEPMSHYVHRLVIENKELFPDLAISDICKTLGFSHVHYFNHAKTLRKRARREAAEEKAKPKTKMENATAALPMHKRHEVLEVEAPQRPAPQPPMFGRFKPSDGQVLVIMGSPEQVREMMQ